MKNTIFIVFLIIGNHILGSEDVRTHLLSQEQRDGLDVQPEYKVDDDTFDVKSTVTSLAFHPTKPHIAYGCENGKVVIYDLESQSKKEEHKFRSPVTALQWSPQGYLAGASLLHDKNQVHILEEGASEFETKKCLIPGRVRSLKFTAGDHPILLTVYQPQEGSFPSNTKRQLSIIDPNFSSLSLMDESEQTIALATGKKNNPALIAYSIGTTIHFLKQMDELKKDKKWRLRNTVNQLDFCLDDARLCIATNEDIQIRELSTGTTIRSVSISEQIVTLGSVQLGEQQVVGLTAMGRVLMLDWLGQEQEKKLQLQQRKVTHACIDSDGKRLVTASGTTIHVSSLAALLNQSKPSSERSGSKGSQEPKDSSCCSCKCIIL